MSEVVFYERLYAAEPSPENIERLIQAVAATGDRERVSQLEVLKKYQEGQHLALCEQGDLVWLMGGPYSEGLWQGNASNLKGVEVLENVSKAMQAFAWFNTEPWDAVEDYPFRVNRSRDWPWLMPVSVLEFAGERTTKLISVLDTREACVGLEGRLVGTFPTIEVNGRFLKDDNPVYTRTVAVLKGILSKSILRDSESIGLLETGMINVIRVAPDLPYVFVTVRLPVSDSPSVDFGVVIDIETGKEVTSFGKLSRMDLHLSESALFRLPATGEFLLVTKEANAHPNSERDTINAIVFGKGQHRYLTTNYVRRSSSEWPRISIAPTFRVSDQLRSNFSVEREQNKKATPPPLTPEALRLRYFKPAPGTPPEAMFSPFTSQEALAVSHLPENPGNWAYIGQAALAPAGLAKISTSETSSEGSNISVYLPGRNQFGTPSNVWMRLQFQETSDGAGVIRSSLAEPGKTERILPQYFAGESGVHLPIYEAFTTEQTGTLLRVTPDGTDPVWVDLRDQDLLKFDFRTPGVVIPEAYSLFTVNEQPATLRTAPRDNAPITVSRALENGKARKVRMDVHLSAKAVEGDWILVTRTAVEYPLEAVCAYQDEAERTEGWLRWRNAAGQPLLAWTHDYYECDG